MLLSPYWSDLIILPSELLVLSFRSKQKKDRPEPVFLIAFDLILSFWSHYCVNNVNHTIGLHGIGTNYFGYTTICIG